MLYGDGGELRVTPKVCSRIVSSMLIWVLGRGRGGFPVSLRSLVLWHLWFSALNNQLPVNHICLVSWHPQPSSLPRDSRHPGRELSNNTLLQYLASYRAQKECSTRQCCIFQVLLYAPYTVNNADTRLPGRLLRAGAFAGKISRVFLPLGATKKQAKPTHPLHTPQRHSSGCWSRRNPAAPIRCSANKTTEGRSNCRGSVHRPGAAAPTRNAHSHVCCAGGTSRTTPSHLPS